MEVFLLKHCDSCCQDAPGDTADTTVGEAGLTACGPRLHLFGWTGGNMVDMLKERLETDTVGPNKPFISIYYWSLSLCWKGLAYCHTFFFLASGRRNSVIDLVFLPRERTDVTNGQRGIMFRRHNHSNKHVKNPWEQRFTVAIYGAWEWATDNDTIMHIV